MPVTLCQEDTFVTQEARFLREAPSRCQIDSMVLKQKSLSVPLTNCHASVNPRLRGWISSRTV